MARLQLIIPLLLWVLWLGNAAEFQPYQLTTPGVGFAIYSLSLALIVMLVRGAARRAMREHPGAAGSAVGRLHQTVFAARWFILCLHALALFLLNYGRFIIRLTPQWADAIETISAVVSILPVAAAWIGLVWAQYPLDRAVREQNTMFAVEFCEPIYPIPTFWQQLLAAFRLQILFTLVPVLLIGLVRDLIGVALQHFGHNGASVSDLSLTLAAVALVFTLSPEVLRRVLPTQPLPPSELRDRLEAMCRRLKLRYRDILIWHTHYTLDNAAVMGIVPPVRYILLSDLLISTMTQEQIEAVFAHEAGHVKHRHMTWYLIFFLTLVLVLNTAGSALAHAPAVAAHLSSTDIDAFVALAGVGLFFLLFGALSRAMERQADVYAALAMTASSATQQKAAGRDGVGLFCSALAKVARTNNMPLDSNAMSFGKTGLRRVYARIVTHSANWLHGSIKSRLDYLQSLVDAPQRLEAFDRKMIVVRVLLIVCLIGAIALTRFT